MPRPRKYVRDNGGEITGLSLHASGRYYALREKGQREYFGKDRQLAIARNRSWQAKQNGERVRIEDVGKLSSQSVEGLQSLLERATDGDAKRYYEEFLEASERGEIVKSIYVDDAGFWAAVTQAIITNPKLTAQKTGIEELAYLTDLKPPPPSKRLTTLVETYLDDKTLSPKEATNSRTWWGEFVSITKAKVVTDLDRESFKCYRKTIKSRQGKHSNVWVRSRFGKIKTIINHAIVEVDLTDQEKNALSHVALLKQPPKPTPKPVDIEPEEMEAILADADDWDTALILLALNAAYTNIDCQRLTWDMVDFKNSVIRFDRSKAEHLTEKELPRICSLWVRTIEALKKLQNGHPHVFVSSQGQPAHIDTMNDHFVECCEKAEIKKRLTFKHLRKSALTSASNDPTGVPDRQINLLAGHSSGIKENYVVRRNVQLACEAIERYYFDDEQVGK